jgi:hypothetical protein
MKNMKLILPQEILTHIFEYDNTYKEILKNDIAVEIWKETWRKWLLHIISHYNDTEYVRIFEDGTRKNSGDFNELELENIRSSIKFSMTYYVEQLLFSMVDLWGFDYYNSNYQAKYPNYCLININYNNAQLVVKVFDIDFPVNLVWSGCILTKEQFQEEKMLTTDNFDSRKYLQNKIYSDDERLLFSNPL